MAEVVGKRLLEDDALNTGWKAYELNGSTEHLAAICGKAENIPDTELAVLYYSLLYQKSHYDAILVALKKASGVIPATCGRWLVADFGAGPGTALLAFAQFVVSQSGPPLDVTYVHVDSSESMRSVAKQYFHADPQVADGSDWLQVPSLTDATNVEAWVKGVDQALFTFSYVLCQPSVTSSTIGVFASAVARTCVELGNRSAYILNVEPNLPNRTKWPELMKRLAPLGVTVRPVSQTLDLTVVYLNPDGTIRDRRSTSGKTIYAAAKLK